MGVPRRSMGRYAVTTRTGYGCSKQTPPGLSSIANVEGYLDQIAGDFDHLPETNGFRVFGVGFRV